MLSPVIDTRQGRYSIASADLGSGPEPVGILLQDPEADRLHVRFRRDWADAAPEDDVLPLLQDDLAAKADALGAEELFSWLEENASNFLTITDRRNVLVSDFERTLDRLYSNHVRSTRSRATHVPLYSMSVAAGAFLDNAEIGAPRDWIEVPEGIRIGDHYFAASIEGTSMEPHIPNGSVCLFRRLGLGSRQGKRVLVEEHGAANERYTVKRYNSRKLQLPDGTWTHEAIVLEPLNPDHNDIILTGQEDRYRVIAEFVRVLF
jgi:phage repressor protein C with HTH and peptisase S24 domain